jgi:hypothetical protein
MDLSGLDLTKFVFTNADLTTTNLKDTILCERHMAGARYDRLQAIVVSNPLSPDDLDAGFVSRKFSDYSRYRHSRHRMSALFRAIQDAPDHSDLVSFLKVVLEKEPSLEIKRVASHLKELVESGQGKNLVSEALNIAFSNMYPLRRTPLIRAIGRQLKITQEVRSFLSARLLRSRSSEVKQAILDIFAREDRRVSLADKRE